MFDKFKTDKKKLKFIRRADRTVVSYFITILFLFSNDIFVEN